MTPPMDEPQTRMTDESLADLIKHVRHMKANFPYAHLTDMVACRALPLLEELAELRAARTRSVEPTKPAKLPETIVYPYRQQRADVLTAHIMHAIAPFLCDHGEMRGPRDVSRLLHDIFYSSGVEIISDADRERAGLHPRNESGLTREELYILEAKHLELMLRPPPFMFTPIEVPKP